MTNRTVWIVSGDARERHGIEGVYASKDKAATVALAYFHKHNENDPADPAYYWPESPDEPDWLEMLFGERISMYWLDFVCPIVDQHEIEQPDLGPAP